MVGSFLTTKLLILWNACCAYQRNSLCATLPTPTPFALIACHYTFAYRLYAVCIPIICLLYAYYIPRLIFQDIAIANTGASSYAASAMLQVARLYASAASTTGYAC